MAGAISVKYIHAKFRFDGADEEGLGNSLAVADCVDTEMIPVDEINIGASGRTEHDAVSRRLAAEGMARRVIDQVRLRLHNRPAAKARRRLAHELVTQKPARDYRRRGRVEETGKRQQIQHLCKVQNAETEMKRKCPPQGPGNLIGLTAQAQACLTAIG